MTVATASMAAIEFIWEDDWESDHAREFDCYADGGPETCERCVVQLGEWVLASLCCIDDADDAYRSEIEAELAADAQDYLSTVYADTYEAGVRWAVAA